MLELFNMGPIDWPQDLESLLCTSAIKNKEYESPSQLVHNQINSRVKIVVDKFVKTFPSTHMLEIATLIKGQPLDMFLLNSLVLILARFKALKRTQN